MKREQSVRLFFDEAEIEGYRHKNYGADDEDGVNIHKLDFIG